MEDAKRWTVTYTKHMKQKRKVYQDGALELLGSCEKVLLYDDCGKLLDSRCLKKDEVVESGGTLTFDTHLVDIGELEGNYKPLKDLNIQRSDKKPIGKMGTQQQKSSLNSFESKRAELPNSGTSQRRPSMIKKIATGNRQIELENDGTPKNHDVHSSREWNALYTTQVTQKAKKYHDGILRLSFCGSHQRQVLLYDDCGKLLDSRYLKKDEVIESGGTLTFDTHLVDIGELEGNYKPLKDLNIQRIDKKPFEKMGTQQQKASLNSSENKSAELPNSGTSHDHPNMLKKIVTGNRQIELQNGGTPKNHDVHSSKEWNALYTTQVTQKAKKYHEGTLRLSFCGSHQRQVMLYDDCGKLIGSRFLKKDEVIESGGNLAFDTHLVDIGDPEGNYKPHIDLNVQGNKQSIGKTRMLGQKENKTAKIRNNEAPSNISRGNIQNDDSTGKVVGSYPSRSNVDMFTSSGRAPRNEFLRDASHIISVLKRPVANESLHSVDLQMEQTCVSHSSDLLQSGYQGKGQNASGMESLKVNAEDKCGDGIKNFSRENTSQIGPSGSNFSQSKETQEIPSLSFTNLIDPEHTEKLQPEKFSASSIALPRTAASDVSKPKLDMEFTDKGIIDLITTPEGFQISEIITCSSPEDNQIHCTKPESRSSTINCGDTSRAPLNPFSEYKQVEESFALTCSESEHHHDDAPQNPLKENSSTDVRSMLPDFSSNDVWVLKDVRDEKPKQAFVDNVEPDARRCEEAFILDSSSSLGGPPGCAAANTEREGSEEFKSLSKKIMNMDDFPSFDLGI